MSNKVISTLCGAALLGTTCLMAPQPAKANMASAQKAYTIVMAGIAIGSAVWTSFTNLHGCPLLFCWWMTNVKAPGIGSWNTDLASLIVDGVNLSKAGERETEWKGLNDHYQAAVRKIGGMEELAEEGAEEMFLDETEVHVASLENTGLPALADSSGTVLKTAEEIIGAMPAIQDGFGSTSNDSTTKVKGPDGKEIEVPTSAAGTSGVNPSDLSEAELLKVQKNRRTVHLQKTATAGIARSYLMRTVAADESNFANTMKSYVGSGKSESANIKVLTGLDLSLAQRLNAVNMVQGQQVANDAAAALMELK